MDSHIGNALPGGAQPLEPDDPATVGPYAVVGRLGEGGMGAVYLARARDGRYVAVKIIRSSLSQDEGFRLRFAAEVTNAERVASFCTAQVLDHGLHEGRPYMTTEYIEGPTLARQVARHGPLAPGPLQGVAVGVAAALTAIHSSGLVHRDLKPTNVILSRTGPRVIDFGIARALDATSGVTQTGELVGSPGWMAPEQFLSHTVGTAADVFSWGCLLAYAGRAEHPYGSGDAMTMAARILHDTPHLDGLPDDLRDLVAAALVKDPERRPTAQELLLTLVGAGTGQSVDQATTRAIESTWQPPPEMPQAAENGAAPTVASGQEAADDSTVPAQTGAAAALTRVESQAPEARSRWRAWPYAVGAVAVAAAVALALVVLLPGPEKGPDNDGGFTPARLNGDPAHPTDAGRAVPAGGPAELTVNRPRCGGTSYHGLTTKGRFCLVPVVFRSTAEPGRDGTVRVSRDRQRLLDRAGAAHPPVAVPGGFLGSPAELRPGGLLAGHLLFDLPDNAEPARLRLFASDSGDGTEVWL